MPNVLIIDDSSSMRRIVLRALDGLDALFFEAGDGLEGETVVQEQAFLDQPIDVVILDWHMPNLTGLQFLQDLRSADAFKSRPAIVMLTAETYPEQIQACLKYGVSAYVLKPFEASELRTAVERALAGERSRHAV